MVEQEIARSIAQHFMQRRPRQRCVERRVEQLFDPRGIQIFRLAAPCIAQRPDAAFRCARARRLFVEHDNLARDRAALGRRVVARELHLPLSRGRLGDFGNPGIRRPAEPLARFGCDPPIGRDQRKLALERLLRGEEDAQRHALPGRDRRRQDRELGRVFTGAGSTLGLCVHNCESEGEKCTCDQQQCRQGNRRACLEQWNPPPSGPR